MAFLLVVNVVHYPRQIPSPERHYPISELPLQRFAELVRAGSFHLADPGVDLERRKESCRDVNVIHDPADSMKVGLAIVHDSVLYEPVQTRLQLRRDERDVVFCMPSQM